MLRDAVDARRQPLSMRGEDEAASRRCHARRRATDAIIRWRAAVFAPPQLLFL